MERPTRTMKELAQEALNVQNACNLSGVVYSFSKALTELRDNLEKEPGFSTTKLNQHPIVQVWVDKLASLADVQSFSDRSFKAFDEVEKLAKGE